MRVAGFDIASRLTGWTVGDGRTVPRCGVFQWSQFGDDLGALLDAFDQDLGILFTAERPDAVVYEAPILMVQGKRRGSDETYTDKPLTLRKLYSLGAYLEFFCRRRGMECSEVTIQAIKKEVTGNHQAEKDAMVAVAQKCGLSLPHGPGAKDAADSWGAWLLALRHYCPAESRRWDRVVFGPRGTLL